MSDQTNLDRFLDCIRQGEAENRYRGSFARFVSMRDFCSFRIGGNAAFLSRPLDISSLCFLLRAAHALSVPTILLGMGSNALLPDEDFFGVLITTRDMRHMEINGTKVKADCGIALNNLILRSACADLGGYELLYGIPATVGGAVYMNAGAHGVAVGDRVEEVEVYDPAQDRSFTLSKEELSFSYRKSLFHKNKGWVLTRATFSFCRESEDVLRARIREVVQLRARTQPLSLPSAGSAFLRPCESVEVWQLIDACGLRGYRIGGAAVSEKHAGFIVNCGGATAKDVRELIEHIRRSVLCRHGVTLTPEICIFE